MCVCVCVCFTVVNRNTLVIYQLWSKPFDLDFNTISKHKYNLAGQPIGNWRMIWTECIPLYRGNRTTLGWNLALKFMLWRKLLLLFGQSTFKYTLPYFNLVKWFKLFCIIIISSFNCYNIYFVCIIIVLSYFPCSCTNLISISVQCCQHYSDKPSLPALSNNNNTNNEFYLYSTL